MGNTQWLSGKKSACQYLRCRSNSWVRGRSPGGGNAHPLQYSCLKNPMDGGVWWATVQGLQEVRHD